MSCRVRWCVSVFCLFCSLPAGAAGQTLTDHRVWVVVTAQARPKPTSPWQWSIEAVLRSRDGIRTFDVFALRPIVIYRLTPHSTVGGGYLQARSFPASGGTTVEHRVFGQYAWNRPAAGGTLAMRTRVEARFIEGNGGEVTRVRQQVRFSHPWRRDSKVSIIGYDELFVHVNGTTRTRRGIDQNRAFAGIGVPVTPRARLEVGYLNQFSPGHGGRDKRNHVLLASLVVQF
jgi:Protein of unknown function (DUF2490)